MVLSSGIRRRQVVMINSQKWTSSEVHDHWWASFGGELCKPCITDRVHGNNSLFSGKSDILKIPFFRYVSFWDEKPIFDQIVTWCHQVTIHCRIQYWPRSATAYCGVILKNTMWSNVITMELPNFSMTFLKVKFFLTYIKMPWFSLPNFCLV